MCERRDFAREAEDVVRFAKIVLSHNHNDSDKKDGITCQWRGGVAMENVRHYRAVGSLYRQFAAFDPARSWKYLIEAQKYERLAEEEIASHFEECNTVESKFPEVSPTA
jgi:hypothetical protein